MASDHPMVQVISNRTKSPRLRYVLDFIFGEVLKANYKLLTPEMAAEKHFPLIEYLPAAHKQGAVSIFDCGQLDEWMAPGAWKKNQQSDEFHFTDDIFAEIFFHLSRMEEYGSFLPLDNHGRQRASDSYLGQIDALMYPRVDHLVAALREQLKNKGWQLYYRSEFKFTASYDVDYPWLFRHRAWHQNVRGLVGDVVKRRWAILKDRLSVWNGQKKDPYDVWDHIIQLHRSSGVSARFFLLFTDQKGVDPSVPYNSSAYGDLVRKLQDIGKIGWHPGYYSLNQPRRWNREKERFQNLIGESPKFSRQHYLRLEWPETYRQLLAAGIQEDYSLGYADQVGFRAGTSHPYFWYDLYKESATPLKLYPLAFMEVTLNKYLQLKPEESFEKLIIIEKQVRIAHGHLIGLWHNNSFYPHEGWNEAWMELYKNFIKRF